MQLVAWRSSSKGRLEVALAAKISVTHVNSTLPAHTSAPQFEDCKREDSSRVLVRLFSRTILLASRHAALIDYCKSKSAVSDISLIQ